jgi:hypothetical protein
MPGSAESSWISFQSWLSQQQGRRTDPQLGATAAELSQDTSSQASTSTENTGDVSAHSTESTSSVAATTSIPQRRLARAPLAQDCRTETRMTEGNVHRGRQEMTLVLAAPGVPLHKAPVITAKQAGALLQALCEPLVHVAAGRLTRRLEKPNLLQPTEERGILSLWLLPNDDLSLVWQSTCRSDLATSQTSFDAESSGGVPSQALPRASSGGADAATVQGQAVHETSCDISMLEELIRFPAGCHLESEDPVVTVHMLRGDTTSRSFYIKPRADVAAAQAALRRLGQYGAGLAPNEPILSTETNSSSHQPDADFDSGQRMYFWLRDACLDEAVHKLGRLKSMVKKPPSLSKRSGVPQDQLDEISSWLQSLEKLHGPLAASVQAQQPQPLDRSHEISAQQAQYNHPESSQHQQHQSGPPLPAAPSTLDASLVASAPPAAAVPSTHVGSNKAVVLTDGCLAGSAAVSATAAAVYRDRRFQVACPCNITVGASIALKTSEPGVAPEEGKNGAEAGCSSHAVDAAAKELMCLAGARAKATAEEAARNILDQIGRQRVEQAVCESLVRSARVERHRAKAQRQLRRELQARQRVAAEMQPMIRRAAYAAANAGSSSPASMHPSSVLDSGGKKLPKGSNAAPGTSGKSGSGSSISAGAKPSLLSSLRSFGKVRGSSGHDDAFSTSSAEEGMSATRDTSASPGTLTPTSMWEGEPSEGATPSGRRVTIANLHNLLSAAGADEEEAAEGSDCDAASARACQCNPAEREKVTVNDLADLLRAPSNANHHED